MKRTFEQIKPLNDYGLWILVKVFLHGNSSDQLMSCNSNTTVGGLRAQLNRAFNTSGTYKLTLASNTAKLNSSHDGTLLRSFRTKRVYLTFNALFQTDKYSQYRLPAICEEISNPAGDLVEHKLMDLIQILNQNAQNCALDAMSKKCPLSRKPVSHADCCQPEQKRAKMSSFIQCTKDIAATLGTLSHSLCEMSQKLQEGEGEGNHEELFRIVQNNMDSCRYLAPLMKNYSSLPPLKQK
jgi:hypothetical protein